MLKLINIPLTGDFRFAGGPWLCCVDVMFLGHGPVRDAALQLDIHGFCLHLRRLILTLRGHPEREVF